MGRRGPRSLGLAGQRPAAGRPETAVRASKDADPGGRPRRSCSPTSGASRRPITSTTWPRSPRATARSTSISRRTSRPTRRTSLSCTCCRTSSAGCPRRTAVPRPRPARAAPPRRASRLKTAPVFLLICDGWGHARPRRGNAITLARTPIFDRWLAEYPWTLLEASGEAVGLPAGVMGNSEVGHLTLGAGRMVPQDLLRIDLALRDGSFFENPAARRPRPNMRSAREPRSTSWGSSPTAGCTRTSATLDGPVRARGEGRRAPRARPRIHSTAATPRRKSARGYLRRLEAALAGPRERGSPRCRAATTPWTATSDGTAWRAPMQALVFSSGLQRRERRGRRRGRLRPRRDGRVRPAHGPRGERRAGGTDPGRRRRRLLQLPGGPGASAHARADGGGRSPTSRARSRRSSRSSDSRSTRRSSAFRPRFRPRTSRTSSPTSGPSGASRTSGWPRPKSTRT